MAIQTIRLKIDEKTTSLSLNDKFVGKEVIITITDKLPKPIRRIKKLKSLERKENKIKELAKELTKQKREEKAEERAAILANAKFTRLKERKKELEKLLKKKASEIEKTSEIEKIDKYEFIDFKRKENEIIIDDLPNWYSKETRESMLAKKIKSLNKGIDILGHSEDNKQS